MASATQPAAYEYSFSGTNVLESLATQQQTLVAYLDGLSDRQAEMAYAPGKWSVKELLGHMTDTERIMSYRALAVSRGEKQPLPGFDENEYVRKAQFNLNPLNSLVEQYNIQRKATLLLVASFSEAMLARTGTANGKPVTVKAITELIASHELHHIKILEERHLPIWQ